MHVIALVVNGSRLVFHYRGVSVSNALFLLALGQIIQILVQDRGTLTEQSAVKKKT